MQQHGCKHLPLRPPTLGKGSLGQNSTFSDHGHVVYQVKGNHAMQQLGKQFFARTPINDPGGWVQKYKIQLYQNMVTLHIKLK